MMKSTNNRSPFTIFDSKDYKNRSIQKDQVTNKSPRAVDRKVVLKSSVHIQRPFNVFDPVSIAHEVTSFEAVSPRIKKDKAIPNIKVFESTDFNTFDANSYVLYTSK